MADDRNIENFARASLFLAAFCAALAGLTASPCRAEDQIARSPDAAAQPFKYVIDSSIAKTARIYAEADGGLHAVATAIDSKGIPTHFVEDEVVVRDDPAEVAALVAKYHATIVRQIIVRMIGADGKPRNCSGCGYVESTRGAPARARRIASRALMERRRAVSMTERMSA